MVLPPKVIHPKGDTKLNLKKRELSALIADTFDGKIHIEWDTQAQVTPLGQLPFFIQYLKMGHLFEPLVDQCPLTYASNNAPKKVNVLGSFFLSHLRDSSLPKLLIFYCRRFSVRKNLLKSMVIF